MPTQNQLKKPTLTRFSADWSFEGLLTLLPVLEEVSVPVVVEVNDVVVVVEEVLLGKGVVVVVVVVEVKVIGSTVVEWVMQVVEMESGDAVGSMGVEVGGLLVVEEVGDLLVVEEVGGMVVEVVEEVDCLVVVEVVLVVVVEELIVVVEPVVVVVDISTLHRIMQ